jgi:hypothetical protein
MILEVAIIKIKPDECQEFRGLIGWFFAEAPVIEHFERVTEHRL